MFDGISISGAMIASSPWVLLGLTFFLIITGKLVPRSTLQDAIDERNKVWDALQLSEQARLEAMTQMTNAVDALDSVAQVIRALPPPPPEIEPPRERQPDWRRRQG